MCAPDLSFVINKAKKILHVPGVQSHSGILAHHKVEHLEDKWVKVGYNWREKSIDIIGENEDLLPFDLSPAHWSAIHYFIDEQVGTKDKLLNWLAENLKEREVAAVAVELLNDSGQVQYNEMRDKRRTLDFKVFVDLFQFHPNFHWKKEGIGVSIY